MKLNLTSIKDTISRLLKTIQIIISTILDTLVLAPGAYPIIGFSLIITFYILWLLAKLIRAFLT